MATRRGIPYTQAQPHSDNQVLEDENERLQDGLMHKVHSLKSLSIDIGSEVRYHNKMLSDMTQEFDQSTGVLAKTMDYLGTITRAGAHRFPCYLVLFALVVFMVIWVLLKAG